MTTDDWMTDEAYDDAELDEREELLLLANPNLSDNDKDSLFSVMYEGDDDD